MAVPFEGGCHCGKVRYRSDAAPLEVLLCHCRDCQKTTGGPFASVAILPVDALHVRGTIRAYTVTAESGFEVSREFCPECGSPLFERAEGYPDIVLIKVGSVDDPSWIKPTMNVWTRSALPWAHRDDDGLPSYPENAPL